MVDFYFYVAIMVGLAIGSLFYPAIALASVFLMFSLEQWGQISNKFLIIHSSFTNICIGLIVGIAFIRVIFSKNRLFLNYPEKAWLIYSLYGYSFVSLLWSYDTQTGLDLWSTFFPYVVITVILGPFLITSDKDILLSTSSLQLFGLPLAILLLFFAEWEQRRLVISGGINPILGNPLEVGTFSAMLFVASIFQKIEKLGALSIIFRLILAGVSAGLLVISGSRGQFFSVLVAIYLLWGFRYKVKSPLHFILAGISIVLITYLLSLAITIFGDNNIRWEQSKVVGDISGRFDNSIVLLSYWVKSAMSIFFGLGNSESYKILGIYPHNIPAEILAEEGVLGFSLYALIIINVVVSFKRIINNTVIGTNERNAGIILSAFWLITFVLSLKQGSFLSNVYYFMFSLFIYKYDRFIVNLKK